MRKLKILGYHKLISKPYKLGLAHLCLVTRNEDYKGRLRRLSRASLV